MDLYVTVTNTALNILIVAQITPHIAQVRSYLTTNFLFFFLLFYTGDILGLFKKLQFSEFF